MALVLYDISISINPNVLECQEGDQIVIEEDFGDWLRATKDGREGFVPYNYVQRMKWFLCWDTEVASNSPKGKNKHIKCAFL